MRRALSGFFFLAAAFGPAMAADRHVDPPCLSTGDTVEILGAHGVVNPSEALLHVRRAVPDSEVLRASLCRETDTLVYRIMLLTRDGRIVRVTVDAPSGKVVTIH
ncbi:MAG: hypothetical protein JWQ36_2512 [Enterovirga sp.]|jgi:uncharacterized membrane protein YkoI|nr:hypothetical protein [Enterovirga sp.]